MSKFKFDLNKYKSELLKFDGGLTVEESALLCPNPIEFYKQAYLSFNVEDFRVISGVKEATKIAKQLFGDTVLQGPNCDFDPNGSSVDAVLLDVCKFSVMEQVCAWDLEKSFISDINPAITEREFWAHYWEVLAEKIGDDIAVVAWQGATAGDYNGFECEGFLEKIENSSDVVGLTVSGAPSVTNIETYFETALTNLNKASKAKKRRKNLVFYTSPGNRDLLAMAAAKNNTNQYISREIDGEFLETYLSIKISVQDGLDDTDGVILSEKSNFLYVNNVGNEGERLRVADFYNTQLKPIIATRVDGHIGFHIINDEEIVHVKTA